MKTPLRYLLPLILAPLTALCGNGMYYWRTTFELNEAERAFLAEHSVSNLHIRFFDVGRDPKSPSVTRPVPVATITFKDPVPANLEIVPVVFIGNDLFKQCDMLPFADQIAARIFQMCETRDIENVREIQIDCDWTGSTQDKFFAFMKRLRPILAKHGVKLSATIRLHQLRLPPPPADKGVLMVYNTGGVRNPEEENSILRESHVKPYAKNASSYKLPLDIAYPAFSWAAWFCREGHFMGLLRGVERDNPNIEPTSTESVFRVKTQFDAENRTIQRDSVLRFEEAEFAEIKKAKVLLDDAVKPESVIIYHLDSAKLSKFTSDEIKSIFKPGK
ncbi:MAG: hypothetical protein FWG05_00735 [Kiritimatiellaeota bacterium]|nr:hypothetical protein [Kiritimatiellota bacterium]